MEPSRESPIFMPITWAPGATPFFSGSSGKWPAAIQDTCVPCEPEDAGKYIQIDINNVISDAIHYVAVKPIFMEHFNIPENEIVSLIFAHWLG